MKPFIVILCAVMFIPASVLHADNGTSAAEATQAVVQWQPGINIETFWMDYANSKGGLTWGKSKTYPEYEKVKEGDTILIQVAQGPCLMEFFHERWRRANDVRRWDPSVNEYGGCPYVFD